MVRACVQKAETGMCSESRNRGMLVMSYYETLQARRGWEKPEKLEK